MNTTSRRRDTGAIGPAGILLTYANRADIIRLVAANEPAVGQMQAGS